MTGALNKDVFGFEISVNDAQGMQVVESAEDLGEVKTDNGRGENAVVLMVTEDVEVRAGAVRDSPGEKIGGFEMTQKMRKKRVVKSFQYGNFPTSSTVGDVFASLDNFEGERGTSGWVGGYLVDEKDSAHCSFAEDFDGFEVVQI